ncbi:cytoplasmic dynein 1 light intermediate chain 2-like [Clavelina lepadiformis]|uniref:cytoplasmic dynein 1 light intermediate chain 2-like n=1 Tax=Clavelina lepadiformis TaxID=159417 RepID=UPI004041C9AE
MEKQKSGGSNIWTTLLSDASSSARSVFSTEKSIIIIGEDLSGKSVLAAKLQGSDDPHRGSGLDFQIIEVEDEDADESGVCRVWIVDGNLGYRSLLQFALPQDMVADSIIAVVVDMSQPWNIPDALDKWTRVLFEHVNSLKVEPNEMEALRQKLVDKFLGYVDPSEAADPKESKLVLTKTDNKTESAQLGDIALSENLGIPVVLVCTKCDQIETLESEYDYREEHFDYIQHYLRQYCLKHGAGLVYTSIKESKNIELLKKYLLHKLYDFPFSRIASVIDRDGVFVPIGWDSEKKISIVSDNLTNFNVSDPFNTVISRPPQSRMLSHDSMKEITVEDEQTFLAKAQVVLNKAPASTKPAAGDAAAMRSKIRVAQDPGRIGFNALPGSGTSPKTGKPEVGKPGASNERMLANFFNSLLNKKPGSPGGPSPAKAGSKPGQPGNLKPRASVKMEEQQGS